MNRFSLSLPLTPLELLHASSFPHSATACDNVVCGPNSECLLNDDESASAPIAICKCKLGFSGDASDLTLGCKKSSRLQLMCEYKNKSYGIEETFYDGCSSKCICSEALEVDCRPRCPPVSLPPPLTTSTDESNCSLIDDPSDSCCKIVSCQSSHGKKDTTAKNDSVSRNELNSSSSPSHVSNTHASDEDATASSISNDNVSSLDADINDDDSNVSSNSFDGCIHGNKTYQIGQIFFDGCAYRCTCQSGGIRECEERCPVYIDTIGYENCEWQAAPDDACCIIPVCPTNNNNITSTTTTGNNNNGNNSNSHRENNSYNDSDKKNSDHTTATNTQVSSLPSSSSSTSTSTVTSHSSFSSPSATVTSTGTSAASTTASPSPSLPSSSLFASSSFVPSTVTTSTATTYSTSSSTNKAKVHTSTRGKFNASTSTSSSFSSIDAIASQNQANKLNSMSPSPILVTGNSSSNHSLSPHLILRLHGNKRNESSTSIASSSSQSSSSSTLSSASPLDSPAAGATNNTSDTSITKKLLNKQSSNSESNSDLSGNTGIHSTDTSSSHLSDDEIPLFCISHATGQAYPLGHTWLEGSSCIKKTCKCLQHKSNGSTIVECSGGCASIPTSALLGTPDCPAPQLITPNDACLCPYVICASSSSSKQSSSSSSSPSSSTSRVSSGNDNFLGVRPQMLSPTSAHSNVKNVLETSNNDRNVHQVNQASSSTINDDNSRSKYSPPAWSSSNNRKILRPTLTFASTPLESDLMMEEHPPTANFAASAGGSTVNVNSNLDGKVTAPSIIDNKKTQDDILCHFKGRKLHVGEEVYDDCNSICHCGSDGKVDCALIECPHHFTPHSSGCLEWEIEDDENDQFIPRPPNCCPKARCKLETSCIVSGVKVDNYKVVPSDLLPCGTKCICVNGNITCENRCPVLSDVPPASLPCAHHLAYKGYKIGDSCCLTWICRDPDRAGMFVITRLSLFSHCFCFFFFFLFTARCFIRTLEIPLVPFAFASFSLSFSPLRHYLCLLHIAHNNFTLLLFSLSPLSIHSLSSEAEKFLLSTEPLFVSTTNVASFILFYFYSSLSLSL